MTSTPTTYERLKSHCQKFNFRLRWVGKGDGWVTVRLWWKDEVGTPALLIFLDHLQESDQSIGVKGRSGKVEETDRLAPLGVSYSLMSWKDGEPTNFTCLIRIRPYPLKNEQVADTPWSNRIRGHWTRILNGKRLRLHPNPQSPGEYTVSIYPSNQRVEGVFDSLLKARTAAERFAQQ